MQQAASASPLVRLGVADVTGTTPYEGGVRGANRTCHTACYVAPLTRPHTMTAQIDLELKHSTTPLKPLSSRVLRAAGSNLAQRSPGTMINSKKPQLASQHIHACSVATVCSTWMLSTTAHLDSWIAVLYTIGAMNVTCPPLTDNLRHPRLLTSQPI